VPALETASLRLFPGGSKRFRIHFLRLLIDKMKQPFSFPRRVFCARVLLFRFAPPIEGWRSAESRRVLARHPLGLHLTRQARRLRGALRPITRDAASRRSHRGGFGLRCRASLTGLASGSVTASSSRPGRSARLAAFRTSRGSGCEPLPQDATPCSVLRIVSRARPLPSKAGESIPSPPEVVKHRS